MNEERTVKVTWGPSRTTFSMKEPADYIAFNSITDNNVVGDERNFVRIGESGSEKSLADYLDVQAGKEYAVWIFFHNNAKSRLNKIGKGISTRTAISCLLPDYVSKDHPAKISAIISSVNANPNEVWDSAVFESESEEKIKLSYIEGSAKIYSQGKINKMELDPKQLFSKTGAYIGYDALDGDVPGCSEYSGHIIFRLKAEVM